MARHEKGDLVRLLDEQNRNTIGKIVEVSPYNVLGHTVRAYDIKAADGSMLKWGNTEQEVIIYLDGLFEKL